MATQAQSSRVRQERVLAPNRGQQALARTDEDDLVEYQASTAGNSADVDPHRGSAVASAPRPQSPVDHLRGVDRRRERCVGTQVIDGGESLEEQGPDGIDGRGIVGADAPPRAVQVEGVQGGPQARTQASPGVRVGDRPERGVERPDQRGQRVGMRCESVDVPGTGVVGVCPVSVDGAAGRREVAQPVAGIPEQALLPDQRAT